jgi:hypothetical protein
VILVHDRDEAIGEKNFRPRVAMFLRVNTNAEIELASAELSDITGIISEKVNVHSWRRHLHSLHERDRKDGND